MKPKRGWRRWIGLGVAVTALCGGAYVGKQYAQHNLLAAILGQGTQTSGVQWHWRQATACAENVEIPLSHATDINDQALIVYAPKLWFVYDQAALLRKRFVFPRVVMEDVLIAAGTDALTSQAIVDIEFDPGVTLGLVEMPPEDIGLDAPSVAGPASSSGTNQRSGAEISTSQPDLGPSELSYKDTHVSDQPTSGGPTAEQKMPLVWVDQLVELCESLTSERTIAGRQVAVDAAMLDERLQTTFTNSRTQAQQLVGEAREIQQKLVNMDNVLRQGQLSEIMRRLELINAQLINVKMDMSHVSKRLDDEQVDIRIALRDEKKVLIQQADQYLAPLPADVAKTVLTGWLAERLDGPSRAAVLLADIMRKPLQRPAPTRGQDLRHADKQAPAFAARSATLRGKLEMDGHHWPFEAQGSFTVTAAPAGPLANAAPITASSTTSNADSAANASTDSLTQSRWQLTIQAEPAVWQLSGEVRQLTGPCSVKFESPGTENLLVHCEVTGGNVAGKGRIAFRQSLAAPGASHAMPPTVIAQYANATLLGQWVSECMVPDDQMPEVLEFSASELKTLADCQLSDEAALWLSKRLQRSATNYVAEKYREAAAQLDTWVANKLSCQKGDAVLLRRDTEQFLAAQQDELRRIMSAVNSLIEQRQSGYYFARQPGEMPR